MQLSRMQTGGVMKVRYYIFAVLLLFGATAFSQVTNPDWVVKDGKVYLKSHLTPQQVLAQKYYDQSEYRFLSEVYPQSNDIEEGVKTMAVDIIQFITPEIIRDLVFEALNALTGIDLRCKKRLDEFHMELGRDLHKQALKTAGFNDKYIQLAIPE